MSPAANQDKPPLLLSIPRECRHIIFSHVADARRVKPRDTLRFWFEKRDIQEQIAEEMRKDPTANVTYIAGYNGNNKEAGEAEDVAEEEDGDEDAVVDEQDDEDENDDQEDQEDEEDVDVEDDVDDDEDEDVDSEEGIHDGEEDEGDDLTADGVEDPEHDSDDNIEADDQAIAHQSIVSDQVTGEIAALSGNPVDANVHQAHEQGSDHTTNEPATQEQTDDALQDGNSATTTSTQVDAATPGPQVVVIKAHPKWRHVPKFMRLTQCPPETNLFLISKQANSEVKAWFYDVATLKIDATASFLHFSFFELALNKLAEAAFSPMLNIKKAEITFVWDTTWLRAEESGFAAAVFPVFLQNRVDFVVSVLLRAPELESVVIHWHDSARDDGAMQLRADTIEPFIMNLAANVDIKDHYIEPDAKPRAKSRAGKQRLEFKAIIDNGCETF